MTNTMINPRGIRFRLTGLFVSVLAATLIIFSSVVYSVSIHNQESEFDIALYNHAVDISQSVEISIFGTVLVQSDLFSNQNKIFPFAVRSSFIQILDTSGRVMAHSQALQKQQLPVYSDDLKILTRRAVAFRTISAKEIGLEAKTHSTYRLLSYLVRDHGTDNFILQIAVPTIFLEQAAKGLTSLLLFGIPIALLIATFGGLYLSGRALAPVAAIIDKAKALSPTQLSERIPVPGANDEITQLALTLNELLDRLQQAFDSQERFIADASHELKTPLAIIKGELDIFKSKPRNSEEITEFIESASQELDHLSRVVEDLLLLARVDAGAGSLSIKSVRIDEIALEAISRLEFIAKKKNLKLRFNLLPSATGHDDAFAIQGDQDLLRSMIKNVVENAIKFSPENGTVEIIVEDKSPKILISVKDEGPGIPEEERLRIFERFYRINNKQGMPGSGLGLAIALRIAQAHNGTLAVKNNKENNEERGTTFLITVSL